MYVVHLEFRLKPWSFRELSSVPFQGRCCTEEHHWEKIRVERKCGVSLLVCVCEGVFCGTVLTLGKAQG